MAVEPECRSQGVGQAMLFELERLAKRQGMTAIVLDAREYAVRFYLKNGYVVTGDSYLLFGEIPHSKWKNNSTVRLDFGRRLVWISSPFR